MAIEQTKKMSQALPWSLPGMMQLTALALGVVLPLSTALTNVVLLLLVLCVVCNSELRKKLFNAMSHPVICTFLGFYAIYVLFSFCSVADSQDILIALRKNIKCLYAPFLYVLFQYPKTRCLFLTAFLVSNVIAVLFGIFTHLNFISPRRSFSGAAYFRSSIMGSFLVAWSAFCCFELFKQKNCAGFTFKRAVFLMGTIFFSLYLLYLNDSRSAVVLLSVLLGFSVIKNKYMSKRLALVLLMSSLTMGYWSSPYLQKRMSVLFDSACAYWKTPKVQGSEYLNESASRFVYAENAWLIFKKKPWFGHGTGSFKKSYATYMSDDTRVLKTDDPHNQYLLEIVQHGLVGLVAMLVLWGTIAWHSQRLDSFGASLLQGIVLACCVGSCMNSFLLDFTTGMAFVVFSMWCLLSRSQNAFCKT